MIRHEDNSLFCDECGELINTDFAYQFNFSGCFCLECAEERATQKLRRGITPDTEPYPVGFWMD